MRLVYALQLQPSLFEGFLSNPVPSIFLGCGFLSKGKAPNRFLALILPKDVIWGRIRKNVLRGPLLSRPDWSLGKGIFP